MIIKNIHVENFGKLHDFTVSLRDGLNSVCEPNGFGKTTLSVFITVMLFGFRGEAKRGIVDNERKRYAPWQGGVYGGRITFEAGGRSYLLERTFGEKDAKPDSFALYELPGMLLSDDFDENIGEEILHIDRDSFAKTAFIGQLGMETAPTSAITAQMGGLAGEMADIASFETVEAEIKDRLNKLTPSRKTGEIAKLKDKIAQTELTARGESGILRQVNEIREKSRALEKERDSVIRERDDINAQAGRIAAIRDSISEAERIADGVAAVTGAGGNRDFENGAASRAAKASGGGNASSAAQGFGNGAGEISGNGNMYPGSAGGSCGTNDRLAACRSLAFEIGQTKQELSEKKLSSDEEKSLKDLGSRFAFVDMREGTADNLAAGIFEIEKCEKERQSISGKISELSKDRAVAGKSLEDRMKSIDELNADIRTQEELAERLEDVEGDDSPSGGNGTGTALLVIGIIIAAAGAAGFFFSIPTAAAAAAVVAGAVLAAVSFIVRSTSANRKDNAARSDSADLLAAGKLLEKYRKSYREKSDEAEELKGRISELDASLSELGDREAHLRSKVDAFCRKCGIAADENVPAALGLMKSDFKKYRQLYAKKQAYDDTLSGSDLAAKEAALAKELGSLKEETGSINSLSLMVKEKQSEIDKISGKISELERQCDALNADYEEARAAGEALEGLKEREAKLQHQYDILKSTEKYLTQAKTNLLIRYMEPFEKSFAKYYEMIEPSGGIEYSIDADLKVSFREQGKIRDAHLLSTGYSDLVNLCSRMAMLDSMYPGEKPVLIMDDPFVNLDRAKFTRALNFLRKAAADYQIIYFSCR